MYLCFCHIFIFLQVIQFDSLLLMNGNPNILDQNIRWIKGFFHILNAQLCDIIMSVCVNKPWP